MTEHPAIPEQAINAGAAAIRDGTPRNPVLHAAALVIARAVLSAAAEPITCPQPEHTNGRDLRIPWSCPLCHGSGLIWVLKR